MKNKPCPKGEWKELQKPRPKKRRTPRPEAGVEVNGMRWRRSKVDGQWLEFCVTPESKRERREQLWLRCQGKCEMCGHDLHPDRWEWHHVTHRSKGGDDSMRNGMAVCKYPDFAGGGVSCHTLLHRPELGRDGKMR